MRRLWLSAQLRAGYPGLLCEPTRKSWSKAFRNGKIAGRTGNHRVSYLQRTETWQLQKACMSCFFLKLLRCICSPVNMLESARAETRQGRTPIRQQFERKPRQRFASAWKVESPVLASLPVQVQGKKTLNFSQFLLPKCPCSCSCTAGSPRG